VSNPLDTLSFDTSIGLQNFEGKTAVGFAWAVSPGNIATAGNVSFSNAVGVPIPGAIWLFGTGMLGLLGLRHRGNFGCEPIV